MKLLSLALLLFGYSQAYAKAPQCSLLFMEPTNFKTEKVAEAKFVNGHNESLRSVMYRMRDFENEIREFVDSLTVKPQSKFLKTVDHRNSESLERIIDISLKYEKILQHLVLHSADRMLTSRIEMIPESKRAEFVEQYRKAYQDYLNTFVQLRMELEGYRLQPPAEWDNRRAHDILMHLHTLMGASHNKF